MSSFTQAVFAERALLAWNDPEGEAEAVCPMDAVDAYLAMVRYLAPPPKSRRAIAPTLTRHEFDNDVLLLALGATSGRRSGKVRCPAHEDRLPSLTWRITSTGKLLLHCFAGCSWDEILKAVA